MISQASKGKFFSRRTYRGTEGEGSWGECNRGVVIIFSWCLSWVRNEIRVNRIEGQLKGDEVNKLDVLAELNN